MRDFWQLDVPLAVVLVLCTVITVIEMRRATDGVWRAWVYSFEWPLIGLFCIWMWYRFKTEGNPVKGLARRWQERVSQLEAEAQEDQAPEPELAAWREYQRGLGDESLLEHRGEERRAEEHRGEERRG